MSKQKDKRKGSKLGFTAREFRGRDDYDYIHKLIGLPLEFMVKFHREYYNHSFPKRGALHKKKHKDEIYAAVYSSRVDAMYVSKRIDMDDTWLGEQKSGYHFEKAKKKEKKTKVEVERVYEENGVKITRYKPVES